MTKNESSNELTIREQLDSLKRIDQCLSEAEEIYSSNQKNGTSHTLIEYRIREHKVKLTEAHLVFNGLCGISHIKAMRKYNKKFREFASEKIGSRYYIKPCYMLVFFYMDDSHPIIQKKIVDQFMNVIWTIREKAPKLFEEYEALQVGE